MSDVDKKRISWKRVFRKTVGHFIIAVGMGLIVAGVIKLNIF